MQQRYVVIFLHGMACTSTAFDPLFADPDLTSNLFMVSRVDLLFYRLSDNSFDVQVRYDTRGHGRTDGSDDPKDYTSKRMSLIAKCPQGSTGLNGGLYSVR